MLGQSGGGVAPFDWSSLVGGALGSSPAAIVLAWRLNRADKELSASRVEVRALNDRIYEQANKTLPLLAEAARALSETQAGMKATIDRAQPDAQTLQRLEELLAELDRKRQ